MRTPEGCCPIAADYSLSKARKTKFGRVSVYTLSPFLPDGQDICGLSKGLDRINLHISLILALNLAFYSPKYGILRRFLSFDVKFGNLVVTCSIPDVRTDQMRLK
jgi:hypothetical protein